MIEFEKKMWKIKMLKLTGVWHLRAYKESLQYIDVTKHLHPRLQTTQIDFFFKKPFSIIYFCKMTGLLAGNRSKSPLYHPQKQKPLHGLKPAQTYLWLDLKKKLQWSTLKKCFTLKNWIEHKQRIHEYYYLTHFI